MAAESVLDNFRFESVFGQVKFIKLRLVELDIYCSKRLTLTEIRPSDFFIVTQ